LSSASATTIVTSFDAGVHLRPAIESALLQNYTPHEVIVIDDGSTDGSVEVIKEFGSRIKWETRPNRGGNHARNRGLQLAGGTYCQFLDGDDLLDEDKLEKQVAFLEQHHEVDLIVGVARIWRGGTVEDAPEELWGPPAESDLISEWLKGTIAQTNTMLWRTEFLRSIGGWNEGYPSHQDNEVVLRAIMAGGRVAIDPMPRSTWRKWSPVSVSSDPRTKSAHSWIQLTQVFQQWLLNTPGMKDYSQDMAESVWSSLRPIAATSPSEARQIVQQAIADGRLSANHWQAAGGAYGLAAKYFGFGVASALRCLKRYR